MLFPKQLLCPNVAKLLTAFPRRKQSVRSQGFRCRKGNSEGTEIRTVREGKTRPDILASEGPAPFQATEFRRRETMGVW